MLVSPFISQGVLLLPLTLSTANVKDLQETERRTFMPVIREEKPWYEEE